MDRPPISRPRKLRTTLYRPAGEARRSSSYGAPELVPMVFVKVRPKGIIHAT